jgi:hypothetical protein
MVQRRRAAALVRLVLVAAVVLAACGSYGNSSGTDTGQTRRDNGQLMAGNGQTTQANGQKMIDAGKAVMAKGRAVNDDDMARLGQEMMTNGQTMMNAGRQMTDSGQTMMKSGQAMMDAGNSMMGAGTQMMDGKKDYARGPAVWPSLKESAADTQSGQLLPCTNRGAAARRMLREPGPWSSGRRRRPARWREVGVGVHSTMPMLTKAALVRTTSTVPRTSAGPKSRRTGGRRREHRTQTVIALATSKAADMPSVNPNGSGVQGDAPSGEP